MKPVFHIALLCLLLAGCGGAERSALPPYEPSPWVTQKLGTDADFRDIFFLDDQRGWLVGGRHNIRGGIVGRTEDGGLTWSFQSGVARPSSRAHLFHLNAVHFIDEDTGVIAADGGIILRTVDGGEHWHQVHREHRVSAHLHDLCFADRSHGWAVGGKIVLRTTDGGRTWHRPVSDDDDSGVHGRALHFLDWREGWAVSRQGLVFHTTDGGETWERSYDPTGSRKLEINSLVFVDRNFGWMVGGQGVILHSPDGGYKWRRQAWGEIDARLTDVHFTDARQGWAVGYRRADGTSVILHTTDAGATWTEQAKIQGEELRAVFFTEAGRGWAVGERVRPAAQRLLRYEPGS